MTHNEKRGSVAREAMLALFTGSIYGATHTLTGHPLDTIKSKMQVQSGYTNGSAVSVAHRILQTEGVRGFFRGVIPPLYGSAVYRLVCAASARFLCTLNCQQCNFVRFLVLSFVNSYSEEL
jgi:hypothetical protein